MSQQSRGGGRGSGSGGGYSGQGGRGGRGRGPGGFCVCPSCGKKVSHRQGVPCVEMRCPDCGTALVRE